MSEVLDDLAGAQPPADNQTPEQIAQMRENWIKYGHDPAQFDAAYAGGVAATPTPDAGVAQTGEDASSLSPEQANAMAASLIAAGVDPATVAAALKAELGADPAPERFDGRSDEQKAWDHEHGMDSVPPAAYSARELGQAFREARIIERVTPEGIADWQTFLSSANVPPILGVGLVHQWLQDAQRLNAMSDTEKTLWKAEQAAHARISAGGEEGLQERLRLRDLALQHMMKTPGSASVISELMSSGVMSSSFTLASFANIGANLERWAAGRPADKARGR